MKSSIKILILLSIPIALCIFRHALADTIDSPSDNGLKTRDLIVRLYTAYPLNRLSFYSDDYVKYNSNAQWKNGFSISYKWIGLSYEQDGRFNSKSSNTVKSDMKKMQLYVFMDRYSVDLVYQKCQGYYLENYSRYNYSSDDPATKRRDIKIQYIGTNFCYSFYDSISLADVYNNKNPVSRSGGSPLALLGINMFNINSDSWLIPSNAGSQFDSYSGLNNIETINLYCGIGYSYAFVIYGNFYAAATVSVAAGLSYSDYNVSGVHSRKVDPALYLPLKYIIAYNSDSFAAGFRAFWEQSRIIHKNLFVDTTVGEAGFFAAVKF